MALWPPRSREETKKTGREKQWGCLGKRGGEKTERKEGQQERSQNIEENIPGAKNSFLRHSQIQSLGLDRVDSGTEERWKPWAIHVHFTKDICRADKREINREKGQKIRMREKALDAS